MPASGTGPRLGSRFTTRLAPASPPRPSGRRQLQVRPAGTLGLPRAGRHGGCDLAWGWPLSYGAPGLTRHRNTQLGGNRRRRRRRLLPSEWASTLPQQPRPGPLASCDGRRRASLLGRPAPSESHGLTRLQVEVEILSPSHDAPCDGSDCRSRPSRMITGECQKSCRAGLGHGKLALRPDSEGTSTRRVQAAASMRSPHTHGK